MSSRSVDILDALDAGSLALAAATVAAGMSGSDPERVAAEAGPLLDWLAAAGGQADLQTRMAALKRHMINLETVRDRLKSASLPVTGADLLAGARVYYAPLADLAARVCRDMPGAPMSASRLKLVLRILILGAAHEGRTWAEIAKAGTGYARNHSPAVTEAELDDAMRFLFGTHGEDIFPGESPGMAGYGGWLMLTAYPPPGEHGGERYDLALPVPAEGEPESYRSNVTRAEVCKELDRVGAGQLMVRRHGPETARAGTAAPGQPEPPAGPGQDRHGHTGADDRRM